MTGVVLLVLAAALAGLAAHPFVTYPLSLQFLPRRPVRLRGLPAGSVALCVCAYNEEKVIRAKAENMIALREQVPELQLSIYVDAASDRTASILAEFAGQIDVAVSPARHGKTYGMNLLVEKARADIIVFSDANVMFAPDAVPRLLARFADPEVGCVCGHLSYVTRRDTATAATGSLYWRLEELTKELESQTGSTMGADGSIFAIRRALHVPPPPDIIDDMFVSLSILCGDRRVVRAADAMAFEETASDARDEFHRKVRISCQAFNVHRLLRPQLRRMSALNRYKYASHKLMRWFSVYFLAAGALCYVAGLLALGAWLFLGASIVLGALGFAAALLAPRSLFGKALSVLSALLATGLGVIRSAQGQRFQVWTPPASARATLKPPA